MPEETEVQYGQVVDLLDMIAERGDQKLLTETIRWAFNKNMSILPVFIGMLTKYSEGDLGHILDALLEKDDNWLKKLPQEDAKSIMETLIVRYDQGDLNNETLESIADILIMSPHRAVDILNQKVGRDRMVEMIKSMFDFIDS